MPVSVYPFTYNHWLSFCPSYQRVILLSLFWLSSLFLRNPGVFPPSAEGHHWVCRAEDRCVPEPQRSGQCHSLLPSYRAGFGKAKPPAPTDRTWNCQLKSISGNGFFSRRVWEILLSSFSCAQGLSGAVLLGSVGMSMGMACIGAWSLTSGIAEGESEYWKI